MRGFGHDVSPCVSYVEMGLSADALSRISTSPRSVNGVGHLFEHEHVGSPSPVDTNSASRAGTYRVSGG